MSRKLLIVDDISANRDILRDMLQSDYDILEAGSGGEALEILGEESVSAVLLDVVMPGMDGFEVLSRLRSSKRFAQLPIIMITASEEEEIRVKSLALGANDFVMKPYGAEVIKHCLKNNIAFREAKATVLALERDRLTGLYSREAFFQKAALEIEKRPAGYFILSCVDIDGFKAINDQHGSETGDRVIKALATALQAACDEHGGLCGRIFADHFICLYPKGLEQTGLIGPGMLEKSVLKAAALHVALSVGRYVIEDKALSVNAMYDRASIARQTIKRRYDTHVAVYDERMRDEFVREREIVGEMNAALSQKQFEVWFQPQYNHATGAGIGAEALVRWRHPQKGLIPPGVFIPIFEQNGFVYELDKYVWEQTCAYLRKWTDAGKEPLPVSVNISRYDVLQPGVADVLSNLVEKYRLPIDLLRLEITESAFSESAQRIVEVVKELLARGFTLEIDDFGSGYSSLNTLKDVPAQILKLDMKFLQSSDDSQRGGNIVESVVRMAKWLGMSVIAEGVETREQADYLRSIGCNYMQGYYFARPMPASDYEEHGRGSHKEERLLTLETVENLDNNSFWDPNSIDALIFNSYVGGACIYEYYNGSIELLRATQKYAQLIGGPDATAADALRIDWASRLSEESRARVTADIEQSVKTHKEVTGEYVFIDLPGCPHETYLRCSMRVIAAAGQRYLVYCINENITAERQAEQKSHAASEQIRSMMDDMPGGFVRMCVGVDGSVKPVYINEGFLKLMGMTRAQVDDIYTHNALAGLHPDDVEHVTRMVNSMLQTEEACSTRFRLLRGGSGYLWLSVFGRVTHDVSGGVYINVYYSDATKQVQEEETQKALLDNLPSGAGIYEFKDGMMSLTYQNKSYWELVGLNDEAYPDPSPMSAVHPDDLPVIMQELRTAIQQNRDVVCDIRLRHLTNGYQPVHLAGRIVQKADGFLIYATFTPRDAHGAF